MPPSPPSACSSRGSTTASGWGRLPTSTTCSFDPAKLRVDPPRRAPVRVTRDDWADVAGLMARRPGGTAASTSIRRRCFQVELAWVEDPYLGFGFRGGDGRLSACVVGTNAGEHGPFKVAAVRVRGRRRPARPARPAAVALGRSCTGCRWSSRPGSSSRTSSTGPSAAPSPTTPTTGRGTPPWPGTSSGSSTSRRPSRRAPGPATRCASTSSSPTRSATPTSTGPGSPATTRSRSVRRRPSSRAPRRSPRAAGEHRRALPAVVRRATGHRPHRHRRPRRSARAPRRARPGARAPAAPARAVVLTTATR